MVDERRVRRLLQAVTDDLTFLRERAAAPESLAGDRERMAALKYVFVTAIEGCLSVAQHVCAAEGWGPPTSNADAMRVLGSQALLDADLAASMAGAVGFRNILVHGYVDVDDRRVVAFLDRLDDLDRYVAAVAARLGA